MLSRSPLAKASLHHSCCYLRFPLIVISLLSLNVILLPSYRFIRTIISLSLFLSSSFIRTVISWLPVLFYFTTLAVILISSHCHLWDAFHSHHPSCFTTLTCTSSLSSSTYFNILIYHLNILLHQSHCHFASSLSLSSCFIITLLSYSSLSPSILVHPSHSRLYFSQSILLHHSPRQLASIHYHRHIASSLWPSYSFRQLASSLSLSSWFWMSYYYRHQAPRALNVIFAFITLAVNTLTVRLLNHSHHPLVSSPVSSNYFITLSRTSCFITLTVIASTAVAEQTVCGLRGESGNRGAVHHIAVVIWKRKQHEVRALLSCCGWKEENKRWERKHRGAAHHVTDETKRRQDEIFLGERGVRHGTEMSRIWQMSKKKVKWVLFSRWVRRRKSPSKMNGED